MKFINYSIYLFIKSFLIIGRYAPVGPSLWLARVLAAITWRLAKQRKTLMLHNLELALGDETTVEEREVIGKKSMESLFVSVAELFHMNRIWANYEKYFTYEGAHHMQEMLDSKRGFFIFGGHYGAWLSMGSIPYRFPEIKRCNLVMRPPRSPRVFELVKFIADKFKCNIVTTRGSGNEILEAVARGEMVGFYLDQEGRRDNSIFIKFFGRDALTHVVPGYMAWKNDIPLMPHFLVREDDGMIKAVFREPLKFDLTDDRDENNKIVTQAITNEIEKTIRERPEQWLWGHSRWRRRPDGSTDPIFTKKKSHKSRTRARASGEYMSSVDHAKKDAGAE